MARLLPAKGPHALKGKLAWVAMSSAGDVEHGCLLVTKDRRLRSHRHPRPVAVW